MSLDLVITLPTGQQETLPMIVRLITERKLQLRMGEDMKTRPNGFSAQDDKNQVILEKQ